MRHDASGVRLAFDEREERHFKNASRRWRWWGSRPFENTRAGEVGASMAPTFQQPELMGGARRDGALRSLPLA